MNNFQFKIYGPYALSDFLSAPDVYIFSLIAFFAAALQFSPFWFEATGEIAIVSQTHSVFETLFFSIVYFTSKSTTWVAVILTLIGLLLPIRRSRIGPVLLILATLYYTWNFPSIIDVSESESEMIRIASVWNIVFVTLWLKFRWWYWSKKGVTKGTRPVRKIRSTLK